MGNAKDAIRSSSPVPPSRHCRTPSSGRSSSVSPTAVEYDPDTRTCGGGKYKVFSDLVQAVARIAEMGLTRSSE
jgi:hypothetical protein